MVKWPKIRQKSQSSCPEQKHWVRHLESKFTWSSVNYVFLFYSDNCARSACIIESSFVRRAQFWSFGNSLEPEFRHANAGKGTFVVSESCPTTQGIASTRSCCGNYGQVRNICQNIFVYQKLRFFPTKIRWISDKKKCEKVRFATFHWFSNFKNFIMIIKNRQPKIHKYS